MPTKIHLSKSLAASLWKGFDIQDMCVSLKLNLNVSARPSKWYSMASGNSLGRETPYVTCYSGPGLRSAVGEEGGERGRGGEQYSPRNNAVVRDTVQHGTQLRCLNGHRATRGHSHIIQEKRKHGV